jgi:hypothetical protein
MSKTETSPEVEEQIAENVQQENKDDRIELGKNS